ncbi:MAG TPA: cytochrome C oxidase subunit IV family protein [Planctomycetota bacterium]|nr:cytochrome C oxidase subunit IV family protein [Planctomycetota bacterium]
MSAEDHSKTYVGVLAALAVGTLLTVLISLVDMGHWGNIAVGLLIATIKASLVVMFFMHLKYEQRWWAGLVLFPLLLVMIIIGSNLADTGLNGKNRDGDLLSEPLPVIPHAGKAGPQAAHH